jgi:hypothetical protein
MTIHTTQGLQATIPFLQNTGAGTRSLLMGPRDISTHVPGWMEYDCREDQSGKHAGGEFVKREWGDGVQENAEEGEVAEGAEEGGEAVGVG